MGTPAARAGLEDAGRAGYLRPHSPFGKLSRGRSPRCSQVLLAHRRPCMLAADRCIGAVSRHVESGLLSSNSNVLAPHKLLRGRLVLTGGVSGLAVESQSSSGSVGLVILWVGRSEGIAGGVQSRRPYVPGDGCK